ncbi:proline racemase family protein [Pseudomonas putida]|nr:proline racemase family protein [Pseudomonas putida]
MSSAIWCCSSAAEDFSPQRFVDQEVRSSHAEERCLALVDPAGLPLPDLSNLGMTLERINALAIALVNARGQHGLRLAVREGLSRALQEDTFVHESIIGSFFDCRVESAAKVGSHAAIMPSVAGWARVMGHNTILVDDRDPLAHGFQLM